MAAIWGTILDSVRSTRGVSTKNVVLLGHPNTGKSTLLARLGDSLAANGAAPAGVEALSNGHAASSRTLDLGLSYSALDIKDESDEETIARLGIYQLPSPLPPYPSLLPLALSRATLLDTFVVIVLDWERPWDFLRDLKEWLEVLKGVISSKKLLQGPEGAEGKQRLETHYLQYVEPPVAGSAPQASHFTDDAPLPDGVLTDNLGINIAIVCTKSDHISALERDQDFKEEQFDYVQQVLRTVALQYGASVFYTSQARPASYSALRAYILHRLFSPSSAQATGSRSFPFPHRANVVEKDAVLVPSGWDSWGKIKVLREKFDPSAFDAAWSADLEPVAAPKEGETDGPPRRAHGALKMYEDVIVENAGIRPAMNAGNAEITTQDEQAFLSAHFDTLQKEREKDPRAAFSFRSSKSGPSGGGPSALQGGFDGSASIGNASVAGPMAGSAFDLSGVERALDRNDGSDAVGPAKMGRKESGQGHRSTPSITSPLLTSVAGGGSGSSSPSLPGAATGAAQNEVLANFFQSLLAARGSGATGAAGARGGGLQSLSPKEPSSQTMGRSGSAASNNSRTEE